MDHVLANSEKPIPEANDDEEEVASLESGEAAKVRSKSLLSRTLYPRSIGAYQLIV